MLPTYIDEAVAQERVEAMVDEMRRGALLRYLSPRGTKPPALGDPASEQAAAVEPPARAARHAV